ncbi:MAG: hypothetical protein PHG48_01870 [Eubacteriales bacterium]|nr:hypothetical protein [Eubacteriales bacterium]
MQNSLFVSNVVISEDEYAFKSSFTISNSSGKTMSLCLSDLDIPGKPEEIKKFFDFQVSAAEIRKTIIDQVIEHSSLKSRDVQGLEYMEKDNKS